MRISDWSSDVCSSDLSRRALQSWVRPAQSSRPPISTGSPCSPAVSWLTVPRSTRSFVTMFIVQSFRMGFQRLPGVGNAGPRSTGSVLAESRDELLAARLDTELDAASGVGAAIGRAHVRTPVPNAHLVCRLLL